MLLDALFYGLKHLTSIVISVWSFNGMTSLTYSFVPCARVDFHDCEWFKHFTHTAPLVCFPRPARQICQLQLYGTMASAQSPP
jgi:hypothetical protein